MGIRERLYPETKVGGFSRVDGTIAFYVRINALLEPGMTVLDLGAGRGEVHHDLLGSYKQRLMNFRGRCAKVIGLDVDRAVFDNPSLDEAHLIEGGRFPIADASVDLIFSDFTFEHVADPGAAAAEIRRVLKPGGWLCARTPNRWGYIGVGVNLIPNRLHTHVLKILQPARKEIDVFPTTYRLNTPGAIRRAFPEGEWDTTVFTSTSEPAYFGNSVIAWRLAQFIFRLTPPQLGAMLMIFVRKIR